MKQLLGNRGEIPYWPLSVDGNRRCGASLGSELPTAFVNRFGETDRRTDGRGMRVAFRLSCLLVTGLILLANAADGVSRDLRDKNNCADYIVITISPYRQVAEKLATFRHEKNGFQTMVVLLDSIMEEFAGYASPDTAIRDFVQYALNNWSDPKPQYFVLAGNINSVPSHQEREGISTDTFGRSVNPPDSVLMIDQWFVQYFDSSGTMSVRANIGRFPAWDSTSLSVMIDKTIGYETGPIGSWCQRAVSLSDYSETDGHVFETDIRRLNGCLAPLWSDTTSVDIRDDSPFHLSSTEFIQMWDRGAAVVAYAGHARDSVFSTSCYFTTRTVDSLSNGDRLPFCMFYGCNLNFHTPQSISIPTRLLEHTNGGAVAVIASEGLMYGGVAALFYETLIKYLTENPLEPLGKAYSFAMSKWGWPICRRLAFLGDPALSVKRSLSSISHPEHAANLDALSLSQNYPNPFNPTTTIRYELSANSVVSLKVYDVLGREVKTLVNEFKPAGTYAVEFDASGLASGVYFYRIKAGVFTSMKKMLLVK